MAELMILYSGLTGNERSVVEVVRRTKTRIVVQWGEREVAFTKRGDLIGGGQHCHTFLRAGTTTEIATVRDEVRRRRALGACRSINWTSLTTEQLEAVLAVVRNSEAPDHG